MLNCKIPILQDIVIDGFTLDLNYFLATDYDDISAASTELPPVIEWTNEKLQGYIVSKHDLKAQLDEAEARAFIDLLGGRFVEMYSGKQTNESVKYAVQLDSQVMALRRSYGEIDAWCRRLYNICESLKAKLELVRSTESTRRHLYSPARIQQQEETPYAP